MLESLQQVQTIQIGTEFYRLVEVTGEHSRLAWEETFEDENAFQGGTPNILSAPADTWHMGGLKSREGFPGTSEYGQNTDGRWPNKLIPGPEVGVITLPDSAGSPTAIFESLSRIFTGTSGYYGTSGIMYRVKSDESVVKSMNLGGSTAVLLSGVRWDGAQAVTAVHDVTQGYGVITRLTALGDGDYTDSWDSDDARGVRLAVGLDRIFKVDKDGVLKNCLTGLDPTVEANWSDEVQCGEIGESGSFSKYPTGLVAYERTALVGRAEGLYGVSEEGKGIPLIRRMTHDSMNCYGMTVIDPHVWVPHARGLYRYMPGLVESAGLERETLNESIIRGTWWGFIPDGQWVYGLLRVGSDTYIMVARDTREGEAALGPLIWDTLAYLPSTLSYAITKSTLFSPPRLLFGHDYDLGYIKLSDAGGSPDPEGTDYRFVTAALRYTHRYHFGDWKDKDFLKVDAVGKGCDANTYWIIWYSADGATYAKVDIDGTEMRVDENKLHTFTLPTTAKGREVQFKLEYVGAANSTMGQLAHFKPYAVPHSLKLRHYNLTLYLAGGTRHDGGVEQRTSLDQLNDLNALAESSVAVDCKGPWGDITIHPKRVRTLEVRQEGHELPRFLVEFVVQKRETS